MEKKTLCWLGTLPVLTLAVAGTGLFGISARTLLGADPEKAAPASCKPCAAQASPAQQVSPDYGRLPLAFEPNKGQTDPQVRYMARGSGFGLYLTGDQAVLSLKELVPSSSHDKRPVVRRSDVVRMKVAGATKTARYTAAEALPGQSHYYLGKDPAAWRTNVPHYGRVSYKGVYPGIDLTYYGNQRQLEYDFVVAPGADPSRIRLAFDGVKRLKVDAKGDLVCRLSKGDLRWLRPVVYQEQNGNRQPVSGRYVVRGSEVRFALGKYDRSRELVIDPVLAYSTYLGGSGFDFACGIDVDPCGNAYVNGGTDSPDFPVVGGTGGAGGAPGVVTHSFVTKVNPTGTAILYSTVFGGSATDFGIGIEVNSAGETVSTGATNSTDFPVRRAFQAANAGGYDAYLVRLDPTGALLQASYLGGSTNDTGWRAKIDGAGNAYMSGETTSANFPLVQPLDAVYGGEMEGYLAIVNMTGVNLALTYSSYFGGSGSDATHGLEVDSSGIYLAGKTDAADLPLLRPLQGALAGSLDGFVAKLALDGRSLSYATYLGGAGVDAFYDVAVDPAGNAYAVGETNSDGLPVSANAVSATRSGDYDQWLVKLNPSGAAILYSSYYGGSSNDLGGNLDVDSGQNAYLAGRTNSADLPLKDAVDSTRWEMEAFVAKISTTAATGSAGLVWSTYLGGNGQERVDGIALDPIANAYVAGMTTSPDFPVTSGVFFPTYRGGSADAFVAKLGTTTVPDCTGGTGNPPPPPPPGQTCCGHITSGGWILLGPNSRGGNNKGTFSAHAKYKKGCQIQGSINYQDHDYKLHVHVKDLTSFQVLPSQGSQGGAVIVGVGTVNNQGSHQVTVRLTDNGEPGRDDLFSIEVKGLKDPVTGAADYARGGDLADSRSGGGNVQMHKCKPGEVPAE